MTATRTRRKRGHAIGFEPLFARIDEGASLKINRMADSTQLSLGQVMDGIIEHTPMVAIVTPAKIKRRPRGHEQALEDLICTIASENKEKLKKFQLVFGKPLAPTVERLILDCPVDGNYLPEWELLQPQLLGSFDDDSHEQEVRIRAAV